MGGRGSSFGAGSGSPEYGLLRQIAEMRFFFMPEKVVMMDGKTAQVH